MVEGSVSRVAPERLMWFRLGQLILLLRAAAEANTGPLTIDRLGYYDFLSANPFLVVDAETVEGTDLQLAGFSERNLDYQSAPQRFANRRARLQHDLNLLVAYGLVELKVDRRRSLGFVLTDSGHAIASSFRSLYADQYRRSAVLVIGRLKMLSDLRLRERAHTWLRAEGLLMDLYDQ
jgi:hypothetical protein